MASRDIVIDSQFIRDSLGTLLPGLCFIQAYYVPMYRRHLGGSEFALQVLYRELVDCNSWSPALPLLLVLPGRIMGPVYAVVRYGRVGVDACRGADNAPACQMVVSAQQTDRRFAAALPGSFLTTIR